jgi:hypothetical protein
MGRKGFDTLERDVRGDHIIAKEIGDEEEKGDTRKKGVGRKGPGHLESPVPEKGKDRFTDDDRCGAEKVRSILRARKPTPRAVEPVPHHRSLSSSFLSLIAAR